MIKKRTYESIQELSKEEILDILERGTEDELITLPISVGMFCANWKFAQNICLKLAEHPNEQIRLNACLGLAHIARLNQKLEKHLVKPVLLRELRNGLDIEDEIEDINFFMGWKIGKKKKISDL